MKTKALLIYGIIKGVWALVRAILNAISEDSEEGRKITLKEALEIIKTVAYETAGIIQKKEK